MKDIPFFTTDQGVASLTLSQIPYTHKAYIRIQDSASAEAFLKECIGFCKSAGAKQVYVTGHEVCEKYPEYTKLILMQADRRVIGETNAALFPVTNITLDRWVEIYNQKVINVPNGAWMTATAAKELLQKADGYFIHRNGELLGIGKASGAEISWLASVQPSAGADVLRALCHALSEDTVTLVVASENRKAMDLYKRTGFVCTQIVSTWFQVL